MRIFLFSVLILALSFSSYAIAAPSTRPLAQFTSVKGKVELRQAGKKTRRAAKNTTATAGQRVVVAKGAEATLRFFEGSELQLNPGSDVTLTRLGRSGQDKNLKFKLWAGKILAKVKKLTSSRSSFEVEAGGVVCGVRGTEYSMDYDPETDKLDLFVREGEVWAFSGNDTFPFGPGSQGSFIDGRPEDRGSPGNESRERHQDRREHRSAGRFDAFYGLNGTRADRFGGLIDPARDHEAVAGQTADDGLMGLGAHTLILQFGFPESP